MATTPQSRKARGRRLQQYVAKAVRDLFGLHDRDVRSAPMGTGGMDVVLSEKASRIWPYACECKNTERLDLWGSWEQAKTNSEELTPLLVVKRNRSDTLAVIDFDTFMEILDERKIKKGD